MIYYSTHENGKGGYWLIWKHLPSGNELVARSGNEDEAREYVKEMNLKINKISNLKKEKSKE